MFWNLGSKTTKEQDVFNAMGSMYAVVLFIGFKNLNLVQPIVAVERTIFYRERAIGMYSALPYAFAQVVIELPHVFVQVVSYGVIACPIAWTLYGMTASEFGDKKNILETGETVEEFVRKYFGFKHEFLGVAAAAVVGFTLLSAFIFVVSIKVFNFQKQ
ncbi:hypothetical protein FH972_026348 [Carpinus fangiana]|uniref:ABC-2 type transporter transmembrane domain-containing protein n=1 Tax=Carpinus fangiana TaxID=176857 RepID=A0A5N6L3P0_9ROSI|nr:hypothetical protein FH972_026348 [Carpinus fangiana]